MPVWREEYSYGINVLITVVAVILIMLSAKTMWLPRSKTAWWI
jgi:hypothetical protein